MNGTPEATLQDQVIDYCRHRGLLVYHTHDSRRSAPGFPDLVIIGADGLVLAELKSNRGRIGPAQRAWIDAATITGTRAYVWRPEQWADGTILRTLDDLARGPQPRRDVIRLAAGVIRDTQARAAIKLRRRPRMAVNNHG